MAYTDDDWILRAARDVAFAMRMEWDAGLVREMRTCIAEWRFGDAMLIGAELSARRRHGCEGSVTDPAGRFRMSEAWLEQRAAEIALACGLTLTPPEQREHDEAARARHARLGVAPRTNECTPSIRSPGAVV